jgi:PKD repeat protein
MFCIVLISCKKEPSANFSYIGKTSAGNTIMFKNLSTNSDSYEWSFGDGHTSTEESPSHIYEKPGTYYVYLATKGDGGTASTLQAITITGTTYTIQNTMSYTLTWFASFYWNGTEITEVEEHGTLNTGSITRVVTTTRNKVYYGFKIDQATYVCYSPFDLTEDVHNYLIISDDTPLYSDVAKSGLVNDPYEIAKLLPRFKELIRND